jgi:hypothetical protein
MDGVAVGSVVGSGVGVSVGIGVGVSVGAVVGTGVGVTVRHGVCVGFGVGVGLGVTHATTVDFMENRRITRAIMDTTTFLFFIWILLVIYIFPVGQEVLYEAL